MDKRFFLKKPIVRTLIFLFSLVLSCNGTPNQPDISLDEIEVQSLDGNSIDLKTYVGKPIVVNYWATWCAPCIQEFQYFEKVKQQFDEEVHFVMVSDESIDKIKSFSSTNSYTFNYFKSTKTLSEYNISLLPITYFFDSNGNLVSKHVSSLDAQSLTDLVKSFK